MIIQHYENIYRVHRQNDWFFFSGDRICSSQHSIMYYITRTSDVMWLTRQSIGGKIFSLLSPTSTINKLFKNI